MSEIVPPTIVAPVDPAAPAMNRNTRTDPMFCALEYLLRASMRIRDKDSQCNSEVHHQEDKRRHDIQGLPAEFLTQRRRNQRNQPKAERIKTQSNGGLELCALQVANH